MYAGRNDVVLSYKEHIDVIWMQLRFRLEEKN